MITMGGGGRFVEQGGREIDASTARGTLALLRSVCTAWREALVASHWLIRIAQTSLYELPITQFRACSNMRATTTRKQQI